MKNLLIAVVGASVSFALMACTDYQGDYSDKYEAAVSEVLLSPSNGGANTITDKRDNQSYEVVQIGSQTWFAQNLNYDDGMGKCPADKDSLCEKYGRLYDANSILRVIHIDDSTQKDVFDKLRALCPEGWRVPNKSDWKTLIDYVANAYDEVGKNLKASEGWYKEGKMIQDANNDLHFAVATGDNPYGFSAFPSGVCWTSSCDVGADAYFWGIADTVLAKAMLTTMLVGYKLSFENDDFVENSDMNYSNNPRAAIRCIQGEITEPYVDRSSAVQLEDEDIEKDTTDLNLSSSMDASSSSDLSSSVDDSLASAISSSNAVLSSSDSTISSSSVVALSSSMEARSSNSAASSSSIAAGSSDSVKSSSSGAVKSSSSVAKSSSSTAKSSSSVAPSSSSLAKSSSSSVKSSSSVAKSSSSIAKSSSSVAPSSSSAVLNTKYDCSLYDCVTTAYLDQGKLASGMYGEYLDTRDNQVYRTIEIGSQTWMAQNLNYASAKSRCYNSNTDSCKTLGRLYLQSEAVDVCPTGWHLPSESEWNELGSYVDGINGTEGVGTSLKAKNVWTGTPGTNLVGFSGLPSHFFGSVLFCGSSTHGLYWTSEENRYRCLLSDNTTLYDYKDSDAGTWGMSVRCLKGNATVIPVSSSSVIVKSSSSSVAAPKSSSSVSSQSAKYDCSKYNCVTTEFLNQEMLAAGKYGEYLDVRDTQVYRTVTIGTQTWMAQNLNYKMKVSYCLNDSVSYCAKYGRLYEYDSASNACPSGWRMPTITDWHDLYDTVGSYEALWSALFYSGTDEFGFSGVPTSVWDINRSSQGYLMSDAGFWWSSTQRFSGSKETFELYKESVYFGYYSLKSRLAVRCIKN